MLLRTMKSMRIIKQKIELQLFLGKLRKRASGVSTEIAESVARILNDVRKQGDRAILRYTRKFDRATGHTIRLASSRIKGRAAKADKAVVKALSLSARRIRRFHEKQKEKSWTFKEKGATLGQLIRPIERVGVYVPGGKAAYPSTVLMNVIPAQVAGVTEIALCVPTPDDELNPYVMAAIQMLGIKEVYRIGGAQAIGALAFGTETIRKVDKIVGPGNIFVATAKKMVFGEVDIDMIAGPSEVLVIADDSADPSFVAADLLSQAEHDELASCICITDSEKFAFTVQSELKKQLRALKRKTIATASLRNYGAIVIASSMDRAVEFANTVAPEHLEIMTRRPDSLLKGLRNAGAVFLGKWTPEPMGDYSAGPNHTLPTGGTSRFFSPLGVYDFVKRTSLLGFSKKGFRMLADTVETIADIEGLEAHANTIRIRKQKKRSN